ncbi:Mitochondrial presequence protease [Tieghemiomyces parasiticus]|uniref:Presequence protease, mitochondrial n=1 Tax=Tieghemiomyces parasiticus TaxID=78921 RepID=A0A9W8DYD7_9FUNG|nr:Mitochondrial presequence protease [Tieghemiomyces parasiticus]
MLSQALSRTSARRSLRHVVNQRTSGTKGLLLRTRANYTTHAPTTSAPTYSGHKDLAAQFAPGTVVHGFRVCEIRPVNEIALTAVLLEHERTGAAYLHVAREDANNVFSVGFNTAPTDSTGVSHILEHTALCGSEAYPVRDPFFKMLNRSMSTFMNAWTAHDYTQYPFATQNKQDYANLRDVYLDAAFRPLLRDMDFYQEGWRVEREDPGNPESPWKLKGVVYNEMKGAFSDAESYFATRSQQVLYPGSTYAYVSGGDPAHIPDLTYEGLVDFHRRHYHPSNARFFSYGDLPLAPQLAAIDAKLAPYIRTTPPTAALRGQLPSGVTRITEAGPVDAAAPADRQHKLSVNFLANDVSDVFTTFALGFMSRLLLSGASSPMYQALIDTNLGAEYAANTGYNPYCFQSSFGVGLQGARREDLGTIETRIDEVLARVAEQGFPPKAVEALIHLVEMGHRHKTADFGLSLMQNISTGWFHGNNPIDLMEINPQIAQLRKALARGRFFEDLAARYFVQSDRRMVYTMEPDDQFQDRATAAEAARLDTIMATLDSEARAARDIRGQQLLKSQDAEQDLSCLPTLTLADIPPQGRTTELEHNEVAGRPVQWRVAPTNGISYLRVIAPFATQTASSTSLPPFPVELRPYFPLFCGALTTCGTRTRTMAELDQDIRLYTGGVSFSRHLVPRLDNPMQYEEGLSFASHALDTNVPRMYDLVRELVEGTDFSRTDRLKSLIASSASGLWNSVAESGHGYARGLAAATLLPISRLSEIYGGFDQMAFLSQLAAQEDLTDVTAKLEQMRHHLFDRTQLRSAVVAGSDAVEANRTALADLLLSPSFTHNDPMALDAAATEAAFSPTYSQRYFPMPFASNFSALCYRTVPLTHPDSPVLQILAKLMTTHYLHREVREKNGAYGGGATFSSHTGLFSFYSYRDPNPFKSVETFRKACEWASTRQFNNTEIMESKLSLFSDLDAPLSVYEEGMTLFNYGITDEMRQQRREAYLRVTSTDVQAAAARYLAGRPNESSSVIIGEQFGEGASAPEGWEVVKQAV